MHTDGRIDTKDLSYHISNELKVIIILVIYLVFSQSLAKTSHAVDCLVASGGFLSFNLNSWFPLFHHRSSLEIKFDFLMNELRL